MNTIVAPARFQEGENIRFAEAFAVVLMLDACGQRFDTLKSQTATAT